MFTVLIPIQLICIILLSIPASAAEGALEKAKLGRVSWSSFQCATWADMSGNKKEHAPLFVVGLKAGREFINAVRSGQVTAKLAKQEAPIEVTTLLEGPSTDFLLGRIFQSAGLDAYDKIVKEENGILLEPSKWINDKELIKTKAQTRYLNGNCAALKEKVDRGGKSKTKSN